MLLDDTKMLLPSLIKISTLEQKILAIKQKLSKRGDGTLHLSLKTINVKNDTDFSIPNPQTECEKRIHKL